MEALFIYVTASSETEAGKIAETIVAERLAACANILSGIKSFYHWQGKVEQGSETAILFKTRSGFFEAVEKRVRELHSYNAPCIVSWPLQDVSDAFLHWIVAETKP